MSSKLFCGGISYESTDESLKNYFEQWGEIEEAKVVTDQTTGKSKGFAFVKFVDRDAAQAAQKGHNGDGKHEIDNRKVEPNIAKEFKIFVAGIKDEMSEDDIKDVFSEFGKVTSVDIVKDKATDKIKGFAFVGFDEKKETIAALKVGAHQIKGFTCKVKEAIDKEDRMKFQQQQAMYGNGYGGGYGDYGYGGGYGNGYGGGFGQYDYSGGYGGGAMRGGGRGRGRGGGGGPYGGGYGRGGGYGGY